MTGETVQQACTFNLTCPLWQILHSPAVYVTMVATHLIQFNFKYLKTGFLTDGCTLKMTVYSLCSCRLNGYFHIWISYSWIRNVTCRTWSTPESFEWCQSNAYDPFGGDLHAHTHTQSHPGLWLFIFSLLCLQLLVIPLIPDRPRPGGFDSSDARCPNP